MITSFLFQLVFIFTTVVVQTAAGNCTTNGGIHLVRGNYTDAAMSLVAVIPGVDDAAAATYKAGKTAVKAAKAADKAGDVGKIANNANKGADIAKAGKNATNTNDIPMCPPGSGQCFTEGTQIVVGVIYNEEDCSVIYVTANIESIKTGDYVLAQNVETGEVSLKEVTDTFVRTSDHIRYLTTIDEEGDEQVIETTDSHPVWVVTDSPDLSRAAQEVVIENGATLVHENLAVTEHGYYVEAKDLKVGDVFVGANGELTTLTDTYREEFPGGITVYNFTVAGNHNYFVIGSLEAYENGASVILVHNANYSIKGRLKDAELPTKGKIRFVPEKGYNPAEPLRKGEQGGYTLVP